MRLITAPLSLFGGKVEIALAEKRIPAQIEFAPFSLGEGYAPRHPEVLRVNPKQQVPILVDGGLSLFDSTQIFEYLEDLKPRPRLWPASPADRARARQLELFVDEIVFPEVAVLMRRGVDGASRRAARDAILRCYDQVEARLTSQAYLAGAYSYADIALFMAQMFADFLGAPIPSERRALIAWREQLAQRPSYQPVIRRTVDFLTENGLRPPTFVRRP